MATTLILLSVFAGPAVANKDGELPNGRYLASEAEEVADAGGLVNSEAAEKLPHSNLDREGASELVENVFGPVLENVTGPVDDLEVDHFLADNLGLASWSTLVSGFVHPAKAIILEAMLWTGRPTSATELEKMAGGNPVLSSFSFHLKQLAKAGILEVVGSLKVKSSQSNKKEIFFYFADKPEWMSQLPLLRDSADPLTELALTLMPQRPRPAFGAT